MAARFWNTELQQWIYPDSLPTFEESAAAVNAGTATALQKFIHDNEPAGAMHETNFREGLAVMIEEVRSAKA